jgi:hypothetical protein
LSDCRGCRYCGVFRSLDGGDGDGFESCGFFFLVPLNHLLDQLPDGAFVFFGFADFGAGGEDAEGGVDGDLFDGLVCGFGFVGGSGWVSGSGCGLGLGLGFGEVEAGDLEAVEEEAGSAGVDVVGGDALEDLADGGLDGGAVFGERQVEGGAAAAALARVGDGFSGGVVVVAELFLAEAGTGAAVSVGEDVAALVLFGVWCGVLHGGVPRPVKMCAESSKETTCVRTSRCRSSDFCG